MKGLLVAITHMETSETAVLAALALLCLTLCPRLKGVSAAFGCFVIDQALQWRRIEGACMTRPIHLWLLGAYAFAALCFLSCVKVAQQCKSPEGDVGCVPQLPQRPEFSKSNLALATVLLPLCLFGWTGLGMYWLADVLGSETPCAQGDGHESITFVVTSVVVLGLEAFLCAVISRQASVIAESMARGSAAVMAIADADFVERWGAPKPVLQEDLSRGLSPAQIDTLPCDVVSHVGESCVICLCPVALDERVRKLPGCSHNFHRCCVDQWLLRSATCPTCKAPVVVK